MMRGSAKKRDGATIAPLVSHEGTYPGSEYDADQAELLAAMQRYMRAANVRFPSFTEVLEVAKALGWRKVAAPATAPKGESPAAVKTRKRIAPYHRKKAK